MTTAGDDIKCMACQIETAPTAFPHSGTSCLGGGGHSLPGKADICRVIDVCVCGQPLLEKWLGLELEGGISANEDGIRHCARVDKKLHLDRTNMDPSQGFFLRVRAFCRRVTEDLETHICIIRGSTHPYDLLKSPWNTKYVNYNQ